MTKKDEEKSLAGVKPKEKKNSGRQSKTVAGKSIQKRKTAAAKNKNAVKNKKASGQETAAKNVSEVKTAVSQPKETGIFKNFWKCLKNYFVFSGRASRYEYFSFALVYFFLTTVSSVLAGTSLVFDIIDALFFLLLIIPMLALLSRRLHDIGKNFWNGFFNWIVYGSVAGLGVGFVVFLCFLAFDPVKSAFFTGAKSSLVIQWLFTVAALLRITVFVCSRGETCANKYGDVPVLNNPKNEKSAFWMIVCYFGLNIVLGVLGSIAGYNYEMSLRENAKQTEVDFVLAQNAIDNVYQTRKSYAWLNNLSAMEMGIIPEGMKVSGGTEIVSALGFPVNFYGFDESYIIFMFGVDENGCRAILKTPWRLHGLHTVQIRADQPVSEALTDLKQCYSCGVGNCEISWFLR